MTKVFVDPGICGLPTKVEAVSEDGMDVIIKVKSACPHITEMFEILGDSFDAYEVCLDQPGNGPLYAQARLTLPAHCGCPTVAGIIKCVEVECNLALPKDASIKFITD